MGDSQERRGRGPINLDRAIGLAGSARSAAVEQLGAGPRTSSGARAFMEQHAPGSGRARAGALMGVSAAGIATAAVHQRNGHRAATAAA